MFGERQLNELGQAIRDGSAKLHAAEQQDWVAPLLSAMRRNTWKRWLKKSDIFATTYRMPSLHPKKDIEGPGNTP